MKKHVSKWLIAVTLVVATSAAAAAETTTALVDQISRAAGGLAAAKKIPALGYDLHIKEATYEADATYLVDRKGRMRIDVYIDGKRVFTECYDGSSAWEMGADGVPKDASASGAAALWHGTQYPGQILDVSELPAKGHKIDRVGVERIQGVDYQVLRLTLRDGYVTYRYVDPTTHLITRGRDVRAAHPDIDPKKIEIETNWSDFRTVDGVKRPFVSTETDLKDGKWLQTASTTRIRKLAALPDALFVKGSAPPDPAR